MCLHFTEENRHGMQHIEAELFAEREQGSQLTPELEVLHTLLLCLLSFMDSLSLSLCLSLCCIACHSKSEFQRSRAEESQTHIYI